MSDYQEYIQALELMSKAETAQDSRRAFNEVLNFLHENFPVPETAALEWRAVDPQHVECVNMTVMVTQDREQTLALLRNIPPSILAVCFPVWVVRYLVRWCNKFYFSTGDDIVYDAPFMEFHRRYRKMLAVGIYNGVSHKYFKKESER